METAGELAQLLEREGELVAGIHEDRAGAGRIGIELRMREPQGERDRDQALLRTVVEIALQAAALDVAGGDDPRSRGGDSSTRAWSSSFRRWTSASCAFRSVMSV
jgi:hypothetical protein